MVTIGPDKMILNVPDGNTAGCRSNVKKSEFDSVFQKAMVSTTDPVVDAESTRFVSDVRPARFGTDPVPSPRMVVDQAQCLIDTMDAYQQKLTDNGATLKDLQKLVEKMASAHDSLSAVSNAGEGQDNLKTIVDQSLMLSSMEIAKFNNGNYNDD